VSNIGHGTGVVHDTAGTPLELPTLVKPVLWFTDGLDTQDLNDARVFLEELCWRHLGQELVAPRRWTGVHWVADFDAGAQ